MCDHSVRDQAKNSQTLWVQNVLIGSWSIELNLKIDAIVQKIFKFFIAYFVWEKILELSGVVSLYIIAIQKNKIGGDMSEYYAEVKWVRKADELYIDNKYSRGHQWKFDGGVTVSASSSPHIVPLPYSVEANVDPEEAFVASVSSCHMLFFLAIAAKRKFTVDEYVDNAVGVMEEGEDKKMSITQVKLRPKVKFSGSRQPSLEQIEIMHHQSHDQCFIANSIKAEVITEIIPNTY